MGDKVQRMIDLTGQTFGRLTVLHRVPAKGTDKGGRFACRCVCGKGHEASSAALRKGLVRSCGCLVKDTAWRHGLTKHPLYHCWYNMIDRCYDKTNAQWDGYGGRGITVCDEWRGSTGLARFIADMGECPPGHSIDRIDNDGHYHKDNCRWSTRKEQQRNMRNSRIITHNGRTGNLSDWARWLGISPATIMYRLKMGRPLAVALSPERFATYGEKRSPRQRRIEAEAL